MAVLRESYFLKRENARQLPTLNSFINATVAWDTLRNASTYQEAIACKYDHLYALIHYYTRVLSIPVAFSVSKHGGVNKICKWLKCFCCALE